MGITVPKDQNKSASNISYGTTQFFVPEASDTKHRFDYNEQNSFNDQLNPLPDLNTLNREQLNWYDKIIRQVPISKEPLLIYGLIFYLKFIYSSPDSKYKYKSLQDEHGEDINNKFIIASHTTVYKNADGKPICKFAAMDSPLGYLRWMDKKPVEEHNDFEYIINSMRKFVVDIDGGLLNKDEDYSKYGITKEDYIRKYNSHDKLMEIIVELIDRFQIFIGTQLDLERDVLLCGSSGQQPNGTYKLSYHLIFTNYMFHYEDCARIRTKLVEGFEPILANKIIDPQVYKSKQQLRLLENQKLGSGRIKRVLDINYHGRIIKHKPYVQPFDDNHLRQLLFLESLIGFEHSSTIIKKAMEVPLEQPKYKSKSGKSRNNEYNLSEGEYTEIIGVLRKQPWINQYFIDSYETNLSSIWLTKNTKNTGECPIHHRTHQGTNRGVVNIDTNGLYKFHCMSSPTPTIPHELQKDIYLGVLTNKNITIQQRDFNIINIDNTGRQIEEPVIVYNNKNLVITNPPPQPQPQVQKIHGDKFPFPLEQFHQGVVRDCDYKYEIDTEYKNGIIEYLYLLKRYTVHENKEFQLGNTYQNKWYAGNNIWMPGHKGDNIMTEQNIIKGFPHLSSSRTDVDFYYNYIKRRVVYFNNVCSCSKEIARRNNLPTENIKNAWIQWMENNRGDDIEVEYDYEEIWEDADPFIWSSQFFLKWIRQDSHDSDEYFNEYQNLYITSYHKDQLKFIQQGKDNNFKMSSYSSALTEIHPLDLSEKTILIKAVMNMKKTVKAIDALVENRISDALFCCQRVLGGVDISSRLKKKLEEITIDVRGTILEQCIPNPQITGTHITREEANIANEALNKLDKWHGDNKPQVVFYRHLEPGEKIKPNTWLVIQVESMPKLLKMEYKIPEAFILDESTAILEQLSAGTIKTKEMADDIIQILELLIKKVPIFVSLCANMDNRIIELIRQLRYGTIYYHVYNKIIGEDLTIDRYTSSETMLNEATEMVIAGKRIFIPCTHKSEAQNLEMYFRGLGKRVLCIHRDSHKSVRDTLLDVNGSWIHYDVVIVTNVITTSVDFHVSHFHAICAFIHNDTIDFRTITQMLRRVRYPIDKRLMIHMKLKNFQNLDISTSAIARKKRNEVNAYLNSISEIKNKSTAVPNERLTNGKVLYDKFKPSAADIWAVTLGDKSKIIDTDKNGTIHVKYNDEHWFSRIHFLNTHEDNMSKVHMEELFYNWVNEQEIPFTFHAYVNYNPKYIEFYKQCNKSRKEGNNKIEEDAPHNSQQQQMAVKNKIEEGDATYEEKVSFKKTKILDRFKSDCQPDATDRSYFNNNYKIINNAYHHRMNDIHRVLLQDNKRFVSFFHTDLDVHKQHAINGFCDLINVPNLLTGREIPNELMGNFDADEIRKKSCSHVLIYFDTRFFTRQPNEPDNGKEISNKCFEVANICTGAFDMHSKTIKQVKAAFNIFKSSLWNFIGADIITGNEYRKQINKQPIRFTPYVICINKRIINIISRLKTYDELDKEYNILSKLIPNDTIILSSLEDQQKQSITFQLSATKQSSPNLFEIFNEK